MKILIILFPDQQSQTPFTMNNMMNKFNRKVKGMLSLPEEGQTTPSNGDANGVSSINNNIYSQTNGNTSGLTSSTITSNSASTPTSTTPRTTPLIMPTKILSYTPSSSYKPVPIKPEVINTTAEINSFADLTNVTNVHKFVNQNITQLNAFSSKGISFIKSNVLVKINSTEKDASGVSSSLKKGVTNARPAFVRQQTMSVPSTPKAGAKMSRQESLLKSTFNKASLKATNSLPTPSSSSGSTPASGKQPETLRPSPPPLNLAEFRIKLAQVRALENVNRLTDVNSITSATYVTSTSSLVPNGTLNSLSTVSRRPSTVSNAAPSTPLSPESKHQNNSTVPLKEKVSTNEPKLSSTPIPSIEITENISRTPSPLPPTVSQNQPSPFPVFNLNKSDDLQISNKQSFLLKRPTTLNFLRSLSSVATNSCDTPSPRSPLSQANYLAPKVSTKLDLSQLDFSKLDLHLILSETEAEKVLQLTKVNPPAIKPPVLTLSDIRLEVRIRSIEKILLSLMQKVSLQYFLLLVI